MKIYAMIPARIGSKRLEKKNIRPFLGEPMIAYAIRACKKSKLIQKIFVSTESEEIAAVARQQGAKVIMRPYCLAEDNIPTQDVMKHFADNFQDMDILALVQANSPNVNPETIDRAIYKLIENNLCEVRSVDKDGLENGAIWIARRKAIYWNGLSVYFGVVLDNSIDIHTLDDLRLAEAQYLRTHRRGLPGGDGCPGPQGGLL